METASTYGTRGNIYYVLVPTLTTEPTQKLQNQLLNRINEEKNAGEGIPLSTYTKQNELTAVAGAPKYPYTLCRTQYVPGNEGAGKNLFVYCTFNKSQDQIQISSVYVATTGSSQSGIGPTGILSNYMDYDQLEVMVPGALLAPLNGSQQDQVGATITLRTNSNDKFYFQDKFITIPTTRTNATTGPYTALVSIEPFFMGGPPNMIGRRLNSVSRISPDPDVPISTGIDFHNTRPGEYLGWNTLPGASPYARAAEWMVNVDGSSFQSMRYPFTIYTFELTFNTALPSVPQTGRFVTQGDPSGAVYPVKGTVRGVGFGIPTSVDASGHIFTLIFDKDLGIPAVGGAVTQGTPVAGTRPNAPPTFVVSGTVQSYDSTTNTLKVMRDHGSLKFTKVTTAIAGAPTFNLIVTANHGTFVKGIETRIEGVGLVSPSYVDGPTLIKGMPPVWTHPVDTDRDVPNPIVNRKNSDDEEDSEASWPIIKSQDGKYDNKNRQVGSFFGKIWDLPFDYQKGEVDASGQAMTSWLQKVRGIASGGGSTMSAASQNNLVSTMYFAQSYILPTFNNQTVFCDSNITGKNDPTKNIYISGSCPSEDFIDSRQPQGFPGDQNPPIPIKIPRSTSIVPISNAGLDFWSQSYDPIMGGPKWMDYYLTGTVYGGHGVGTEGGNTAIPTLNRFQKPTDGSDVPNPWAN